MQNTFWRISFSFFFRGGCHFDALPWWRLTWKSVGNIQSFSPSGQQSPFAFNPLYIRDKKMKQKRGHKSTSGRARRKTLFTRLSQERRDAVNIKKAFDKRKRQEKRGTGKRGKSGGLTDDPINLGWRSTRVRSDGKGRSLKKTDICMYGTWFDQTVQTSVVYYIGPIDQILQQQPLFSHHSYLCRYKSSAIALYRS